MKNIEKFYWFTWIPKIFFIVFWLCSGNLGWLIGWAITTLAGLVVLAFAFINIQKEINKLK